VSGRCVTLPALPSARRVGVPAVTGRSALALTGASIAASALNYLYQVHAAAVLDATAFGLLSTWLARVTVVGAIATVVQFLSLDFALADRRFAGLLRSAGIAAVGIAGVHLYFGGRIAPPLLAVSAVLSGTVLYAVIGQLQARLQLGVVAAAVVAAAAVRFGLPFAWPRDARASAFYVSHTAAAFAGIAAAAGVVTLRRSRAEVAPAEAPPKERRLRLVRPILLAFVTVLFPVIDVLVVSATQDAATTGAFSRIALASRIVFFGGAVAVQVLLPHELHAAASGKPLPRFAVLLQQWLTPGVLAGAIVLAALLDRFVLQPQGEERTWLYASCLAAALLVAVLGQVNRLSAADRLGAAASIVAGVLLSSGAAAGLAAFSTDQPVTRYTVGVLVGDALVLLVARFAPNRAR
jgi:hypothetical protein